MRAVTKKQAPTREGAEPGDGGDAGGVRSVQRAVDILALLTEARPVVSIREMVDSTGLAKTTVIRLVQTLEQAGLLWATPKGYTAGPGLWRWAHLTRKAWELPPETRQLMAELAQRQRETVNLYIARDVYRVCVAQQESPQPLRHVVQVGDELPLWAGASAKVLLRDASPALLQRVARSSPYGESHVDTLRTWIDDAVVDGYATSTGERESGLSAVAVPVAGRSHAAAAALTLSGPTIRFTDERIAEFVDDLKRVAARISERGFDHPLAA